MVTETVILRNKDKRLGVKIGLIKPVCPVYTG